MATIALFLLLEVAALLMMANSSIFQQVKISGVLMQIHGRFLKAGTHVKYYFSLKNVNEQLAQENSRLLNQLAKYQTQLLILKADSVAFKSLSDSSDFSYIPAKIIGNSTNKRQNYILIDKGRKDGVGEDMGVVSPNGVVGIVSAVSDNYAYIISILNINQGVSAKISRSGAFGPLIWDGKSPDYALLTEIPQHIKLQVGDSIVTSGFSAIFPPDIPLGTIRKSKIIMGTHHEIQVKLFQDFRTLQFVNVVVNSHKEEIDTISTSYEK
ncbi:MAG: rod shape-determining protein MreC [Rikenellaceae bacterium]